MTGDEIMEYTKEQLEAKVEELSLKALEIMGKIYSLKETRKELFISQMEIDLKINELQSSDLMVPETLRIRKVSLKNIASVLSKIRL